MWRMVLLSLLAQKLSLKGSRKWALNRVLMNYLLTSSAGAQQTHRIFYDFQRMGEKHEDNESAEGM
jgi:hypothetical protein